MLDFVFRNWRGGECIKNLTSCVLKWFFPLMQKMEYVYLKGSFIYALKITTLTNNEHAWFCLDFYL